MKNLDNELSAMPSTMPSTKNSQKLILSNYYSEYLKLMNPNPTP